MRADKPSEKYTKSAKLAQAMQQDLHYTVDEKQKAILITDDGYEAAEDVLQASFCSQSSASCCKLRRSAARPALQADKKQKAILITDDGYEATEDVLQAGLPAFDCL